MTAKAMATPDTWVDEHGDALFRYALARLRDRSLAEEMVQETLLAALQSYEKFAGRSSERTWLVGILKHKIIDHYRRASRQSSLDPEAEEAFEHNELFRQSGEWAGHWDDAAGPNEWRASPATAVEQAEFWAALNHCLEELSPRIAAAFTLREVEQLETDEICKALDVSTTNLWVMLHRARMHLRNCLQSSWFGAAGARGRGDRGHL